ncbi:serine-rich adhesin for platelets isoform X3 [Folsomia candida]|uniref:serine-rich adhesin for platelets isoform X3 n=1 Tax=Folsomia candida TaxID=158441 RepID=UPI000B900D65|nr:serine-rich adhesin for platelets isoform X3 [Folsomia candida]
MAEGSLAKKSHILKGPSLLGRRTSSGPVRSNPLALRTCGSVGSLNVFERSQSGTIKVKSGGVGPAESSSMANLAILTQEAAPTTAVTSDNLGATVYISGVQSGILKFFGKTTFKSGLWCGIELPQPQGNHDGMVDGVRYFQTRKNCGIFAPVGKVSLKGDGDLETAEGDNQRWSLAGTKRNQEADDHHVVLKGSKRPKPASEQGTGGDSCPSTVIAKKVVSQATERKKRRKLEDSPSSPSPSHLVKSWSGASEHHDAVLAYKTGRSSSTSSYDQAVKVPNFAEIEINELNLREEMERCGVAGSMTPDHCSTPSTRRGDNNLEEAQLRMTTPRGRSASYEIKVAPLIPIHQRMIRPSMIHTLPGCPSKVIVTPERSAETGRTFIVHSDQSNKASRPTSLDIRLERGDEDEEPPSEENSSDTGGLFGQKTPDLWDGDGMSLTGLSSPEEAGIQEESSLGLQTPSQLFESWGELKDEELELYQHLRSPSIDNLENLDFEEDEEDTHNADEEDGDANITLKINTSNTDDVVNDNFHQTQQQQSNEQVSPNRDSPSPPQTTNSSSDMMNHHPPGSSDPDRCDSSVISVSGYEAQTDSDFATESEADHEELLLSHPTHTAPNKNRNARVIDGALYTTTSSASTTSSQPSSSPRITTSVTSEEPESSSSGFYSSSESGSLTRGGSRHPSKSASNSDCDSSSGSVASNNDVDHEEEATLLNSTTTEDASSTITTERNSPEEGDALDSTLIAKIVTPLSKNEIPLTTRKPCLDDSTLAMGGAGHHELLFGEFSMLRSQSVSCLTTSTNAPPSFLQPVVKTSYNKSSGIGSTRTEKVTSSTTTTTTTAAINSSTAATTATKNMRVKGKPSSVLADTVASSSRRIASSKDALFSGIGRLGGSTRSLASSTSNLSGGAGVASRSPGSASSTSGRSKLINKWDHVMAKINEGKGKQINVKEVKAKVFDRMAPTPSALASVKNSMGKGSTSSLGGSRSKRTGLRSEIKDSENEPVVSSSTTTTTSKKGGPTNDTANNNKGTISTTNKRGGIQRTDSTSSDGSDLHGERKQFVSVKQVKSRPKKDGPRRQISDVSTASECSSSQPHPPKSRGGSIPCPPAGNPNSAPSQQDQDSQSRSTAPKSSSVNNNRTTAKNKTITRTGTATQHGAPYTNAPQVNSLNRISPTSTTATNVAMGTRSKSRKSFAISAKPLDDNNATVSSKGAASITTTTTTTNSTKQPVGVPSGPLNNNARNAKATLSHESSLVKPLRDHNRIPTSGSHPAPISKSKEGVTTRSRSRRDEKDHHLDSATPTLREQLARLKQEVDRLQGEHVVKDGQLQELTALTNQTEEERVRLVTELAACSRKVEAMAIVVQNTVDKSDIATSHTHTANQRICQLESLLKNAENELKQVPILKEKLDMNEGMHLKEIVKHKRAHKKDVEKLKSEFLQQIDESRSSYEEKLVEQEKAHCQELDRLKEAHRLEMESYRERHINMSPHDVLIKDVASMSAVIEMNNLKMKDMQTRIQVLTMKEEELIKCENLVRTLSARVEDVEAQLNLNKDEKLSLLAKLTEAELALVDAAGKNKSLAQSVDELSFKLNNPDIVPASPSASNFKEPA